MGTTTQADAFAIISQIMGRHGATCSVAEFHAAVNVTFHEFESVVYDEEHSDMWQSLPVQFTLLADDCISAGFHRQDLKMLDIGSGTGLATDCLLRTELGSRVKSVDLLDTSPAMLQQAARRAAGWKIPFTSHNGLIDDLPPDSQYDLIITCSVLHHVPDLAHFLKQVRQHQAPGGSFLHLQDPNGDHGNDPELRQRMSHLAEIAPEPSRFTPSRILGWLERKVTGKESDDYVSKTNRSLLQSGVINTPLTVAEVYSITDIHVEDGKGISVDQMKSWLPEYRCVAQRSYGFFGKLWSHLPDAEKREEESLIQANAQNGFHVSAAWSLL